jgi:hypothetical protein
MDAMTEQGAVLLCFKLTTILAEVNCDVICRKIESTVFEVDEANLV